jgi:hypothetical protein
MSSTEKPLNAFVVSNIASPPTLQLCPPLHTHVVQVRNDFVGVRDVEVDDHPAGR